MGAAMLPHIEGGEGVDRSMEEGGRARIGKVDRFGNKNSFDSTGRERNRCRQPRGPAAYDHTFGIHSRHPA